MSDRGDVLSGVSVARMRFLWPYQRQVRAMDPHVEIKEAKKTARKWVVALVAIAILSGLAAGYLFATTGGISHPIHPWPLGIAITTFCIETVALSVICAILRKTFSQGKEKRGRFQDFKNKELTLRELHDNLNIYPLAQVREAMTNLTVDEKKRLFNYLMFLKDDFSPRILKALAENYGPDKLLAKISATSMRNNAKAINILISMLPEGDEMSQDLRERFIHK